MAKLVRSIGASLRAKTHDEDDTIMKGRGANHVFRNLAFQEGDESAVATSTTPRTPRTPHDNLKKNNYFKTPDSPMQIDATPRARDAGHAGASAWTGAPDLPTPTKRTASTGQASITTPRGSANIFRTSSAKRPKNATAVEEIGPGVQEEEEDGIIEGASAEECASASQHPTTIVAVRHIVRGPSVSSCTTSSVRVWEDELKRLIGAGRHEDAVRWTAPSDGLIRCTVRRVKNFLGNTLAYHLYLDSGDTFLLAARKRKKTKASNFVLSSSQEDLGKGSECCVGKLRANFVGTEYSLCSRTHSHTSSSGEENHSRSSGSGRQSEPCSEGFHKEEMAVHYKQTALTSKGGPRVMLVATPLPESSWSPTAADHSDSLSNCLESARRRELAPRLERQLCMLATRPPEWDPTLKAHTLDFHGRVRASSVKNFQLVHWDHNTDRKGSDLVLQFGKIEEGSEDFALDFTYPLTVQKAFSIALASIDSKLCYAI